MILELLVLIPLFLCWGSFLNVVAFRLLHNHPFFAPRSQCPSCKTKLAWYDLIPVISWYMLNARCRTCKTSIHWLYPLIELLTALTFTLLFLYTPQIYWFSYMLFTSALIVTIRTDLDSMMILRLCSLGLIPVGLLLSYLGYLPVTLQESALGAFCGYALLWSIRKVFWLIRRQEGMGEGDQELLAGIGAFLGPYGVWQSLLIGSIVGSIIGIALALIFKKRIERLPFGPLLALGALCALLFT